jgi:hypothetical protein
MLKRSVRHRSRLPVGAIALAIGALCATAALALAAHPVEGAHYKGKIENAPVNTKISFKVSQNGEKVHGLKTKADPIFVSDGCTDTTPDVEQESDPAHISHKGKFRGVIHYTYTDFGTHAKAIVKGKFHRHGKESGKVIATFPANPTCDGTAHYSTEAQ